MSFFRILAKRQNHKYWDRFAKTAPKTLSLRLLQSLSLRLGAFASLRTSSIAMTVSSGKNSALALWNYSQRQ
jgi:hypothetical protein